MAGIMTSNANKELRKWATRGQERGLTVVVSIPAELYIHRDGHLGRYQGDTGTR